MATIILGLSWTVFLHAFESGEMSNSAGGLLVWPARLMIPVGFTLLIMQGGSELIKRIGFLQGRCPDPSEKPDAKSAEEQFIDMIKTRQQEGSKQ